MKTKAQISCTVTVQLINAFCFSLYRNYLNPIFHASSDLLWLYSLRFVLELVGNPEDRFSHDVAQIGH